MTEKTVYAAMLSEIGESFLSKIQLESHMKDMLEYTDCFSGRQGVVSKWFLSRMKYQL
jgi:hypothetical protein